MKRFEMSAETGCGSLQLGLESKAPAFDAGKSLKTIGHTLAALFFGQGAPRPMDHRLDGLNDHLLRDIGLEDRPTAYWLSQRKSV